VHPRVAEEWPDILDLHPEARYLMSPDRIEAVIELPAGVYSMPRTGAAVLIPPGYRSTGLDGFLVPAGLALASGAGLPASDATALGMPGWLVVSFHYFDAAGQSTWRPSADPRRGDNVVNYLASVEAFLAGGCA
jgi:hypothetical protein